MSESHRAIDEIEALQAGRGKREGGGREGRRAEDGAGSETEGESCPDFEKVELALSERELSFIHQNAALMDHYCKPVVNISQRPMTQAIFSAGGRYASFVLPSPLRGVRILGKMAAYSAYLQKKGRDLGC